LDTKEQKMLRHYKNLIENRLFDEYDILGFLILVRSHLDINREKDIREFSDLIAHRKRDRGEVVKCIKAAIDNKYETNENGHVKGYHGIDYSSWVKQWQTLGADQNISLNEEIIKEITLCVFSLAQHSEYRDANGNVGKIDLFQSKDNSLALATSENKPDSCYVCFAKFGNFNYVRMLSAGHLEKPVETVRENGRLRLLDEDGYII